MTMTKKEKTLDIEFDKNTFIITRGAPGSVKSTLVESIVEYCELSKIFYIVCNVDSWFMKDGQYVFNKSLLGKYHSQCQKKAWYYTGEGAQVIIIDNTNVNTKECEPYAKIALEANYTVQFREPKTDWAKNPEELFKRNIHGVPMETIQNMLKRWEDTNLVGTKLAAQFDAVYDKKTQTLRKQ